MRRRRTFRVGVAAALTLGVAACGKSGGSAPAGASGAAPSLSETAKTVKAASDRFVALAADAYKTGEPPRATDPKVGPLLDTVFNADTVKGRSFAFADLEPLNTMQLAIVSAGMVYVLAGSGVADPSKADPAALKAVADRNTARFNPEIGRWTDAQLAVSGALGQIVAGEAPGKAAKPALAAEGKAKVAAGMTQTLGGVLTMLPTAGLSDAWRADRLRALDATTPKVVKLFNAQQCAALRQTAQSVAPSLTTADEQSGLKAFEAALTC